MYDISGVLGGLYWCYRVWDLGPWSLVYDRWCFGAT